MPRPPTDLDESHYEAAARMLRCLGHPVRLRVLDLLERAGEATVTEVQEALGIEQASCSQHLSLMHDKGMLERRRDGVHVLYRIGDRRASTLLTCLRRPGAAGSQASPTTDRSLS